MSSEDITIDSIDARKIVKMKKTTSFATLAEDVKRAFNEIGGKLLVAGGSPSGHKFVLLHHKDGRLNPDKLDIEICVPVAGLSKPPIDWELDATPAIKKAACLTHKGPYNKDVGPTYDKLYDWLDSKGLAPTGPFMEVYLHEPFLVKAELLETKIICPLPDNTEV